MGETSRVLVVGADSGDPPADAVASAAGLTARTVDGGGDVAAAVTPDVEAVLLVDRPPAVDALDELAALDAAGVGVPVAVVTADDERAGEALGGGAADCLHPAACEDTPAVVASRLERAVGSAREVAGRGERELARYDRIIRGVGDTLYETDADGNFTHVNPAGARMSGYTIEELLEGGPTLIYDGEDLASFEAAISELWRNDDREVARVEADLIRQDGETLPIEATLTLRRDEDGGFAGTIGVARDMTERKERERELREYESIVRALPDEVAILDTDGYITRLLPPAGEDTATSGYDPEELEGEHVSTVMTEESLERGTENLEELLTTDRQRGAFEMQIVGKDGQRYWREDHVALLEGPEGEVQGTVGVLRDIEERMARERELERYARLIEASGDAVYALDTEGRFTFSNESHQQIVDRPESELLGEHASIALPNEAVADGEALIRELLESDRRQGTYEMDVLRPDGERIPTENHVALLTDEDGEFRGTVGVLRDISARQARQRELERQNERLERFAEIASHDLRNPLNVAQGYLELVREDCESEHADRVGAALERMERLIDDTLAMARQGGTVDERTVVDVGTLAPDCWEAVATDGAALEVVEDVSVWADESRLRQVLENLLRNAVEHGSTSPRSDARGDAVEHGGEDVQVRIGPIDDDGFYVADDGPGIPPGERESVFEAGHSTADDGTGFGLAIVGEVVDAHGWDIAVTDSEAGGARFEITGVDVEP